MSPSSLQEAKKNRLDREEHPHPGHTVRKPKVDPGELTPVLDVSDDMDQEPDIAGEYTGASLNKPAMPPDFTLCGAFRTEAWTTEFSSAYLFQLNGKDGMRWGYVRMFAASTHTEYSVSLGHVWQVVFTESVLFPLT
jgi:hypothetical protein